MNKATCIIQNCVLYSTNNGVENYMSDSEKKKPADQPTFENVGGCTLYKIFFTDDLSVKTVDNIVSLK